MKNTMTISDRFIKASKANQFTMTDDLEILNHLVNKYNFMSVADYARKESISPPAALKRLTTGKVMYVEMIGKKFIFN